MRSDKYEIKVNNEIEEEQTIEETKPQHKTLKLILLILFILILIIILYSKVICPSRLNVNEYKIENSLIDNKLNGLKIVHFSDLHYGSTIDEKKLNKIVKEINLTKPDIVVFTGDLVDKNVKVNEETENKIIESLNNIESRLYKYAIPGDEDNELFNKIINKTDFIVLENKEQLIYDDNYTPIVIAGFKGNDYSILDNNEYYKIALIHKPDEAENVNANLVLSGHSLGGIINIFNPIIKLDGAKKYNKEYQKINDKELFISYGLGSNSYKIRFNTNPSFNLYRLYKAE